MTISRNDPRTPAMAQAFLSQIPNTPQHAEIPKIIWMFWHSGLDDAPDVVKRSVKTWQYFNPDHEVRLLSIEDLNRVLEFDFEAFCDGITFDIGWPGKSDLIRLLLLARFGGIWADATSFCLWPLNKWLHPEADEFGFFCFRHYPEVRNRELISWFMAARPGHFMITDLLERSLRYAYRPRQERLKIMPVAGVVRYLTPPPGAPRPGQDLLARCETEHKKVPYFWMFYLFQETIDCFPAEFAQVRAMTNQRLQAGQAPRLMLVNNVAKQNRSDEFLASPRYRKVKELLFSGETLRSDFVQEATAARSANSPPYWTTLNKGIQISEARKLIFVHIPKCGGTSIDKSDIFKGPQQRFGHMGIQGYRAILGDSIQDYKVLCLTLNPWDRLVSAFHFASLNGPRYNNHDTPDAQYLFDTFDNNFDHFLEAFIAEPKAFLRMLWFKPMVTFFDPRVAGLRHFIQKLETLNDSAALRRFVEMPDLEIPHLRVNPHQIQGTCAYTAETFDAVGQIYQADIDAFGYGETTRNDLHY